MRGSGSVAGTPANSARRGRPRKALVIDLTKLTEVNAIKEDPLDEQNVLHQGRTLVLFKVTIT